MPIIICLETSCPMCPLTTLHISCWGKSMNGNNDRQWQGDRVQWFWGHGTCLLVLWHVSSQSEVGAGHLAPYFLDLAGTLQQMLGSRTSSQPPCTRAASPSFEGPSGQSSRLTPTPTHVHLWFCVGYATGATGQSDLTVDVACTSEKFSPLSRL